MIKFNIKWDGFNKQSSFINLKSQSSKTTAAKHIDEALTYFSGSLKLSDEAKYLNIGLLLDYYISKFNITLNCEYSKKLKKLLTNIKD